MSKKSRKPTLEEMVEDLQRNSRDRREEEEKPKLVVRSDGSEMMKVRKKKRRTKQPRKEAAKRKRKYRFLLIASLMIVVFLFVLAVVLSLGYHNSQDFHSRVQQTVANKSGAKVELGLLTVGPSSAQLDDVKCTWEGDQGALRSLSLQKVNASYGVSGFWGGTWRVDGVTALQGQLVFKNSLEPVLPGTNVSSLNYENDFLRCSKMDIHFGELRKEPAIESSDVTLKIFKKDKTQLSLSGGQINLKPFQNLRLDNALFELHKDSSEMSLRVTDESKYGSMTIEGTVPLNVEKRAKLTASLVEFPIKEILPLKARRFFEGRINSDEAYIDLKPDELSDMELRSSFKASVLNIHGFQFFKELSGIFGDKWYERPRFNRAVNGEIYRVGDKLHITNFYAESSKYLKIEGSFLIESDGSVSGTFRIGLPADRANPFRERLPKEMFKGPINGFMYTNIKLSGTVHDVKDDFMSRIDSLLKNKESQKQSELTPVDDKSKGEGLEPRGNDIQNEYFGE